MKYIVLSTSVIDEIHFADGSCRERAAGGAGIYALAGMKVWHDDAGIVTGVGRDYFDFYGDWYKRNGLTTEGLVARTDHTPLNVIRYHPDGERTETPRYGLGHYRAIEPTPADLARHCAGAAGVYVFRNSEPRFWEEVLALKEKFGFALMWEIGSDATVPGNRAAVRDIARRVDVFSINRAEALAMLASGGVEAAIDDLLGWGTPMVYLRSGGLGAYVLAAGRAMLVPSVKGCAVVDVTGGGNGASGGALVGFCETGDPVKAAVMGSISASFCIAQYGVPDDLGEPLRARARSLFSRMMEEVSLEK